MRASFGGIIQNNAGYYYQVSQAILMILPTSCMSSFTLFTKGLFWQKA